MSGLVPDPDIGGVAYKPRLLFSEHKLFTLRIPPTRRAYKEHFSAFNGVWTWEQVMNASQDRLTGSTAFSVGSPERRSGDVPLVLTRQKRKEAFKTS